MVINTYTCLDCGAEFDTPAAHFETHGFSEGPYERWSVCPYCASSAITHTHLCDYCSQQITGPFARIETGAEYCENCFSIYDMSD